MAYGSNIQNRSYKSNHIVVCLFFVSLFYGTLRAQSSFTLKDNKIENSPNLSIGGTFFGADIYNPNLAFFVEGKLTYRLKKERGWIKANYSIAFGDRIDAVTESGSSQDAVPVNGTQALRDIGGSIGYNFIKREDFKVARATFLGRNKKISIPLKLYRLYGVHVGYSMFRTVIAQGSTTSYTGTVVEKSLNGTTLEAGNATPMFHMNIYSIGIHRQYIEHYKVQLNNGGDITDYTGKSISTVYADFLIGSNMKFDNIKVPLNGQAPNTNTLQTSSGSSNNDPYNFYEVDINDSYKKNPIGGRIGWEQVSLKPLGFMVGAEIGFRPGIFDPFYNAYIMMKIGLMFNFKAK